MELKHLKNFIMNRTFDTFNRTLWNWNYQGHKIFQHETTFNRTLWNWNLMSQVLHRRRHTLLIVPYGIETYWFYRIRLLRQLLLIVPYGIETWFCILARFKLYTFNRTLWNWNLIGNIGTILLITFNRTLWNWNRIITKSFTQFRVF